MKKESQKLCLGEKLIFLNFVIMVGLMFAGVCFRFSNLGLYMLLMQSAMIPVALNGLLFWIGSDK